MNDFIFNFIFAAEKNKPWSNSNVFRKYVIRKYGIVDVFDTTRLYIAINKYQVKKFGRSIQPHEIRYSEEYLAKARTMRQEKYNRKK